MKEKLKELFEEMSNGDLLSIHREYCYNTNRYDDLIYDADELDDVFGDMKAYDIACRIHFGNFNPQADYFTFDGYGNIKSIFKYELQDYIYENDIIDYIIDNNDALYNDDIQALLDEFEAIEERAEAEEE